MKVFTWNELTDLQNFCQKSGKKSAITIGCFDGPHLGHKALFDKVLEKNDLLKGVVSFSFSSMFANLKKNSLGELSTDNLKIHNFALLGFDFLLLIDFSLDFSRIKGRDFLETLRKSCSMQFLTVGSDFHCGHNLDTGVAEISDFSKQHDLDFSVCEQVFFSEKRISSSQIRDYIFSADFDKANKLLLFPYTLDTSAFEWKNESSENQKFLVANRIGFQVFPKNGKYPVKIFGSNKDLQSVNFSTNLYVESNFLRLEIPLEQDVKSIEKITF